MPRRRKGGKKAIAQQKLDFSRSIWVRRKRRRFLHDGKLYKMEKKQTLSSMRFRIFFLTYFFVSPPGADAEN
jgi:hypothetical protein